MNFKFKWLVQEIDHLKESKSDLLMKQKLNISEFIYHKSMNFSVDIIENNKDTQLKFTRLKKEVKIRLFQVSLDKNKR
jgi:hypothetical protein